MKPRLTELYSIDEVLSPDKPWPQASIFKDPPERFPTVTLSPGSKLYHGTHSEEEWETPHEMTWFSTDRKGAAAYEPEKEGRFRVLEFTVTSPVVAIYYPPYDDRKTDDADYWLRAVFDVSFRGLGMMRIPDAFAAVCKSDYDGLYIAKEDMGRDSLMICRPDRHVRIVKP